MSKNCPGSGTIQMLTWLPTDDGYPGATVCNHCSLGIQVRKGSVHEAVSQTGFQGYAGTLKSHKPPREFTSESSNPSVGVIECANKDCDQTVKDHAWGKIKAEGWFFQKDDTAWCPDHNPEWVAGWRARKAEKQNG